MVVHPYPKEATTCIIYYFRCKITIFYFNLEEISIFSPLQLMISKVTIQTTANTHFDFVLFCKTKKMKYQKLNALFFFNKKGCNECYTPCLIKKCYD